MDPMPEHTGPDITASVVLVGNFNPAIFHPSWFIATGLMSESDFPWMDDSVAPSPPAEVLMSGDMTTFRATWCDLFVTTEHFQVRPVGEGIDRLLVRDLAI